MAYSLINEVYLKTYSVELHDGLVNDAFTSIWKWPWHEQISRNISGGAGESHDECQESIQSLSEQRQKRQHSSHCARCAARTMFNPSETLSQMNYIWKRRSFCAMGTVCLGYKNQSLMLHRETIAVYSEIHRKQIQCVDKAWRCKSTYWRRP